MSWASFVFCGIRSRSWLNLWGHFILPPAPEILLSSVGSWSSLALHFLGWTCEGTSFFLQTENRSSAFWLGLSKHKERASMQNRSHKTPPKCKTRLTLLETQRPVHNVRKQQPNQLTRSVLMVKLYDACFNIQLLRRIWTSGLYPSSYKKLKNERIIWDEAHLLSLNTLH